jgi:acyl-CoA synthetase (AMP-forming)/AMP-acid ligase II
MAASPSLLSWCDDPKAGRGIHFGVAGEEWDFWSYARLARLTRGVAAGLTAAGLHPGDVVCIVAHSGPEFVAALFGSMLAGAAASPIAPPTVFQEPAVSAAHLAGLLRTAGPRLVVTEPDLLPVVEPAAAGLGAPAVTVEDLLSEGSAAGGSPAHGPAARDTAAGGPGLALLQFTSGSSGRCRGVRVPRSALAANVAGIRDWLAWTAADPVASWLPVHHDMGLIGCLITPVVSRSDLWLLRPEEFLHRPARYLRCFGEHGARLTATPNFALDYIASRVRPDSLAGCDFSQWRAVIVGAEQLRARSFERFQDLLTPFGLPDHALRPAYGLAEGTLAVTGLPLAQRWAKVGVDPGSYALGQPVRLAGDPAGGDPAGDPAGGHAIVGCGRPLAGVTVTITHDGTALPDGSAGEVTIRGASVAAGYADGHVDSVSRFDGPVLYSGDAGFLLDGQLFILGRLGDSVKVRGRAIFAEDLEAAVGRLGIPAHRLAVAAGTYRDVATVVAVLEDPAPGREQAVADALRRHTEGARIVLAPVPRGAIPRTTSGKVQRYKIWREFLEGNLPGLPRNTEEMIVDPAEGLA